MLKMSTAILGAVLVGFAPTVAGGTAGSSASAELKDRHGKAVGTVEFRGTDSGVMLVTASVQGLAPGDYGFHIHETGRCDPAGGFESAGGHLSAGEKHGVLTEDGPHPGDLPNISVAEGGNLSAEFFVDRLSVEGGWFEDAGLFDDDGSAVVIHSGADDYTSQPSGDAGDRIACGVIER